MDQMQVVGAGGHIVVALATAAGAPLTWALHLPLEFINQLEWAYVLLVGER